MPQEAFAAQMETLMITILASQPQAVVRAMYTGVASRFPHKEQVPRSPRRNGLPVIRIDDMILVCHEYQAVRW